MADPEWSSSPPEVNHARLIGAGAGGTATTLAAATAWQTLMGCHETAASLSAANTAATAVNFEGIGGASSAATATGLNIALQLLAGWVQEKVPIATAAVSAYEAAVSSMIPAAVSIANRAEQAADVALNPLVFGALTPAIVALDAEYFGEHWPQNASAGIAYGTSLSALAASLTVPPPLAAPGASPAAPATAAAAVAQTAGQVAAGEAMKASSDAVTAMQGSAQTPVDAAAGLGQAGSMMSAPAQAAMGLMQPAMGLLQAPLQSLQSLTGTAQPMGSLADFDSPEDPLREDDLAEPLARQSNNATEPGAPRVPTVPLTAGGRPTGTPVTGGIVNPGLTSYNRPSSGFATEASGRPTGLLSAATAVQGPTTSGTGSLPAATSGGMLGNGRQLPRRTETTYARVTLDRNGIR